MGIDPGGTRFCDECGSAIQKAHRVHAGHDYCAKCYPRVFIPMPCSRCAQSTRAHRALLQPVCAACERETRRCLRCDRPMIKAGRQVGARYACNACAPHFRQKQPCPACGKASSRLARTAGSDVATCDACRNRLTHETCAGCRKYRLVVARSDSGRPYCANCVPGSQVSHACPDCGVAVPGRGTGRCLRCYNREACTSRAVLGAATLNQPWVRDLFTDYAQWLWAERPTKPALHKLLEAHLPFFARLDTEFTTLAAVKSDALQRQLGSPVLRKYLLASRFVRQRLGLQTATPQDQVDAGGWARARQRASEHPAGEVLIQYADWLVQQSVAPRTARLYLSAAAKLCEFSRVTQNPPPQHAVEEFLRRRPGHRNSLSRFCVFASQSLGWAIALGGMPTTGRAPTTVKRLRALLDQVSSEGLRKARALDLARIVALSFGYAQPKSAELPMIEASGAGYVLVADGEHLPVPPLLAAVAGEIVRRRTERMTSQHA